MQQKQTKNRTILIADDEAINRCLLRRIFGDAYTLLEADDGQAALDCLQQYGEQVCVVLLDLRMPRRDGYQVLTAMQQQPQLRRIPVVVITADEDQSVQQRALELGAVDVISKPFSASAIRRRVDNIVERMAAISAAEEDKWQAELVRVAETDAKTGLWNKQTFCRETKRLMLADPHKQYVIARWDLDNFKMYNDTFGTAQGDALLSEIGRRSVMLLQHTPGMLSVGHYDADHFVFCWEREYLREEAVYQHACEEFSAVFPNYNFSLRYGFYAVEDLDLDVALMCDRALLALRSVKNNYLQHWAWYEDSMRAAVAQELEITQVMKQALREGQFVAWYQPQYNYDSGELIGAEALARWQHPQQGLIPPDKFIPVFEKNGFIFELDYFIWQQACRQLRAWQDMGLSVPPLSVNVSRRDLYNSRLVEVLLELVQQHRVDPSLLHLEITESAYMDNPEQLIRIVSRLQELGFAVEMDDFGSGYSSLNTLKDVPVDLLKLDMKFVSQSINAGRGGSILSSVVRMAHSINLAVLAEGVENQQQAEYLKSVGCLYMQGYYFSKPLSAADFTALLSRPDAGFKPASRFRAGIDSAADFLDATTQSTLLFNSFLGGSAIMEYQNGQVAALRLNDRYFEVVGCSREQYAPWQYRILDRLTPQSRAAFIWLLEAAINDGQETAGELCSLPLQAGGDNIWLMCRLRCLAEKAGSYIFYVSIENISTRKQLMDHNAELSDRLSAVINSVPGGVLNFEISSAGVDTTYRNATAVTMFGFEPTPGLRLSEQGPLGTVHPDDLPQLRRVIDYGLKAGLDNATVRFRHITAQGGWRWVQLSGSVLRRSGDSIAVSTIMIDIDAQVEFERLNAMYGNIIGNLPVGVAVFEQGATLRPQYVNDKTCEIFGFSRAEYDRRIRNMPPLDFIPDFTGLSDQDKQGLAQGRVVVLPRIRARRRDGGWFWLRVLAHSVAREGEAPLLYATLIDISDQVANEDKLAEKSSELAAIIDAIPGGVATYQVRPDGLRLLFASEGVGALTGRTPQQYEQLINVEGGSLAYEADRPQLRAVIEQACRDDGEVELSFRATHQNGELIWLNLRGRRLGQLQGYPVLQAVYHNLSVTTALYDKILNETDEVVFVADRHSCELLFVNAQAERLAGLPRERALGRPCYEYIKGRNMPCDNCLLRQMGEQAVAEETDYNGRHYALRYHPIDWNGRDAFLGTLSDRTESWQLRQRMDTIIHNVPVGLMVLTVCQGRLLDSYLSDGAFRVLGLESQREANSLRLDELLDRLSPVEQRRLDETLRQAAEQGGPIDLDLRLSLPDGTQRCVNYIANSLRLAGEGEIVEFYGSMADVSERRQMEQQLRISEAQYRTAVQQSGRVLFCYYVADRSFRIPDPQAFAGNDEEYIADGPHELVRRGRILPESASDWLALFDSIERGQPSGRVDVQALDYQNRVRWFAMRFSLVRAQTGQLLFAVASAQDVTDERQRQKDRAFELDGLLQALGTVYPVSFVCNLTQNSFYCIKFDLGSGELNNQAPMEGSFDQLIQLGVDISPPEERDQFLQTFGRESLLAAFAAGRDTVRLEHRQRGDDGQYHWKESTVLRVADPYDDDVLLFTLVRVIDAERRTAAQLQQALELTSGALERRLYYSDVINSMAPDLIIVTYDGQEAAAYMIGNLPQLLGCSGQELDAILTHERLQRVHAAEQERLRQQLQQIKQQRPSRFHLEFRLQRQPSGQWAHLSLSATRFCDNEGNSGYVCIFSDISERRATEEELRISEEETHLSINYMGQTLLRFDVAARSLSLPPNFAQRHGLPQVCVQVPDNPIFSRLAFLRQYDNYDRFCDFFNAIIAGQPTGELELCFDLDTGETRWQQVEFVTVFNDEDQPARALIALADTTDRHLQAAADKKLRREQRVLRAVAEHSQRVVYRYDLKQRRASALDAQQCHALGLRERLDNLPQSLIDQGLVLPDSHSVLLELFADVHAARPKGAARLHVQLDEQRTRWFDLRYTYLGHEEGDSFGAALSLLDITDQHERELSYARFMQSIDSLRQGNVSYIETDLSADLVEREGGELQLQQQQKVLGLSHSQALDLLLDDIAPEQRERARAYFSRDRLMTLVADGQMELSDDWPLSRAGGGWYNVSMQFVIDPYSGHIRVFTTIRDVSREKEASLAVQRRAERDGMTGLYNRAASEELIRQRLCRSDDSFCLMVLLDLDDLKGVNDGLGHSQGDRALVGIAEVLRQHFRSSDILGRIGGDEFIAFLSDVRNEAAMQNNIAALIRKLSLLRVGEQNQLPIHCSAGCALGQPGQDDFAGLYNKADTALYHVKRNGKNEYAFYTPQMTLADYSYQPHQRAQQSAEAERERSELQGLIQALCSVFPLVVSLNLTQDSYALLQSGGLSWLQLPRHGALAQLQQQLGCEQGAALLERQTLLQAYAQGQRRLRQCCCPPQAPHQLELVVLLQQSGEELSGFALLRPLDFTAPPQDGQ